MSTTDLGWCMARCTIEKDLYELTIMEPASEDSDANSITLTTLESIIALRDLIDEAVAEAEESAELAQDLPAGY